jgi:hypothetical protein
LQLRHGTKIGVYVSKQKLRIKNTVLDNLISNLRGEVGEVVTSWVLLRHIMARERELSSEHFAKDLANQRVGDEREFTLGVRVLTGFRAPQQD